MSIIQYTLIATTCLSISYLSFLMFFKNETSFKQQRIFLMSSMVISLILPVTGLRLNVAHLFCNRITLFEGIKSLSPVYKFQALQTGESESFLRNINSILSIYSVITAVFLVILAVSVIKIFLLYRISRKTRYGRSLILINKDIQSPFSFFSWIFIPANIPECEVRESILIHESIHVSQYHSIDNLLVELIAAVMWFNPLVWMMKKSLHLVHEYLADEGTLSSGVDRVRYQALLINQVTEERLVCLSSSFNNSLIKKRMIMMTRSKNDNQNKLKILTIVPISTVLLLIVAVLNGLFPQKTEARNDSDYLMTLTDPQSSQVTILQDDSVKKETVRVVVMNKDQHKRNEEIKVIVSSDSKLQDTIIYVVDGKQVNGISNVNPDSIKTVDVRKADKIVIITSKKSSEKDPEKIVISNGNSTFPDNIIYYIDGKKATKDDVNNLKPEDIESMDVVKSTDNINNSGNGEKCDGVIKIITKQKDQ